eukprot:Skav230950  [mRNA]  locus=scaffold3010:72178:73815:- [translate_table: standard]
MPVHVVSLSAPCPPWSGASSAPGLSSPEGCLLIEGILECRFLRPKVLLIEQVANFAQHPHRAVITRALHWIGFKIIFQRTLNITDLMKVDRPRWFALAVRVHAEVPIQNVPVWNASQLTPPDDDVIFQCWTGATKQTLELTDAALAKANDPNLLRNYDHRSSLSPLQQRTKLAGDVIPTFMRMYGRQHELDDSFLTTNKFYGHYLADEKSTHGCRHWHPTEIAFKHGLTNQCFIFEDVFLSWSIQGNVVTAVQVLPLVVATCNGFWNMNLDVQHLTKNYVDMTWRASETCFQRIQGGFFMSLLKDPIPQDQLREYEALVAMIQENPTQNICWYPADTMPEIPPGQCEPTLVSPPTSPEVSDSMDDSTAQYQVVLKGKILFEDGPQMFWFSADMPYAQMPGPWDDMFAPSVTHAAAIGQPTIELRFDPDYYQPGVEDDAHSMMMVLDESSLSLIRLRNSCPMRSHPTIRDMMTPHDQFGPLPDDKFADENLIVMPAPLPITGTPVLPVLVVAAFPDCRVSWAWNPVNDHLIVGGHLRSIHSQEDDS